MFHRKMQHVSNICVYTVEYKDVIKSFRVGNRELASPFSITIEFTGSVSIKARNRYDE